MSTPNTLTEQERAAGWRLLFDGHSLSGWRGYRMAEGQAPANWRVEDGAIHVHGANNECPGDLITVEQFGDFELSLEWTCPANGNSGIMYRVTEDEEQPYMTGPEYQILDDRTHAARAAERGQEHNPLYRTAGCYGIYAPPADMEFPLEEWNHARIIVRGDHVEHYLNGRLAVRFEMNSEDWKRRIVGTKFADWPRFGTARRGHIDLQDHGHHHAFRTIKIREL